MIGGGPAKKPTGKVRRQPKTIEEFYKARAKDQEKFYINDAGDLVASAVKDGETEKIFTLPQYRTPTKNELVEADQERRAKILAAENAVQEAQHVLREKLEAYRNGDAYSSDVVLANIEVAKKEKELQSIAYPLRNVIQVGSLSVNELLLDQRYEDRKFAYEATILRRFPFTLQEMYVREGLAPDEELAAPPEPPPQKETKQLTAAERGRLGGIIRLRKQKG